MIILIRMKFSELYNNITTDTEYTGFRKCLIMLTHYVFVKDRPVSSYHSKRNDNQRVRMQGRSLSLCLIAGASVSLVLMLTFNALAGAEAAPSIFLGSVSDSSNKYETAITPAGKYLRKY